MTTEQFWSLYLPALASLFGFAILTGIVYEHGRSAWRRWRVRREILAMMTLATHCDRRRLELDGLATARDKAERKIQ